MNKVLLLHGWNNDNYTSKTKETDAWHNRAKFVKSLEGIYKVYKLNFPGFCGEVEPDKPWTLDDYALYVKNYLEINKLKVDYIIGYSFGGAVAIKYNRLIDNNQKIILISPAIARKTKKNIKVLKTPEFITPLRNKLRDLYLINVVKNPYMIDGTKFLRGSYQNIVRVDLTDELNNIDDNKLGIIFGGKDTMIKTHEIYDMYKDKFNIYIIDDGGHDIANSHTKKVIDYIEEISNYMEVVK